MALTCHYASCRIAENRPGKIANVALYQLSYTPARLQDSVGNDDR